jgi:hypothetical protein
MESDPGARFESAFAALSAALVALWLALHWPLVDVDAVWPAWLGAAMTAPANGASPVPWLAALAALVALWTLAGRRVVRAIRPDGLGRAESLGFAACVGLGVGGTLLAVLALVGALRAGAIAAVALAWGACALVPGAARAEPDAPHPEPAAPRFDPLLLIALGATAMSLALSLLHALAPPWQPDALYYQLTLPRLYLDAGGFVARPEEPVVSAYPGLGQMLFALPLAAGRDDLAAALHWVHLPLFLLGAYTLVGRLSSRRGGLLAVACLGGVPQLFATASVPLVDVITAAHLTWALHAACRAAGTGDARWAALGALPLGFALANKYLALPAAALIVSAQALALARRAGAASAVRATALALVLAALPCVPWAVKNARDWGSPAFPLHVPASASDAVRTLVREHQREFAANGQQHPWYRLPLDVTFRADPDDIGRFQGEVGPLVLALLALLALGPPRGAAAALGAYALALLVVWATATRQVRFLYPALPPLLAALLAGRRAPRALAPLAAACAVIALAWTAGRLRPAQDLPYVAGRESRRAYYRSLSATASLMEAYDALASEPPGKVAFFWEYRGYHCPRPYLPEHAYRLYALPHDPAALRARLRELGASHVLVNRTIWQEQRAAGQPFPFEPALEALLRSPAVTRVRLPECTGPRVELYRLTM